MNFNFDFRIFAQKILKPCANDVLKFKFFFLNLSSKVSAGVRVRMSKFPYMNKGVSRMQDFCKEPNTKKIWIFLLLFYRQNKC